MSDSTYRGRLAPSPTGLLHLGHARTFWIAQERAHSHEGVLVLRNENLDGDRCQLAFLSTMMEDLRWFGFQWQEGPDCGGPFAPYTQSERGNFYRAAFEKLRAGGFIYPCVCSRQDVLRALQAPHINDEEPIYPGTCRPTIGVVQHEPRNEVSPINQRRSGLSSRPVPEHSSPRINWRFLVPEGEVISFTDCNFGPQQYVAGDDFGDFVIWRHDDLPSYQLAVVVDDAVMQITEVVRGEDLLVSTARQLLLYRALDLQAPQFYHCPLVRDDSGVRLSKRHDSLSLRMLRERGFAPEKLRHDWKMATDTSRI